MCSANWVNGPCRTATKIGMPSVPICGKVSGVAAAMRNSGYGFFQGFGEALAAFRVGDAVILIGAHDAAAADAVDQPAVADLVDRRGLFGEAQRVGQRQHLES